MLPLIMLMMLMLLLLLLLMMLNSLPGGAIATAEPPFCAVAQPRAGGAADQVHAGPSAIAPVLAQPVQIVPSALALQRS